MEYGYIIAERYICRKPLGKGGNATVFLCYDNKLLKYWAVKACQKLSDSEIYALKSINHYAFPRIVDVVRQDDMEYLIMDYIEGETLASYCNNHIVKEKQQIIWFKKIASALHYLHNMNPSVFYVDCKPENIMITPSGDIRIIDLGSIYVDTKSPQTITGTRFFAPHELTNSTPSVSSDIYSLGMTMYYLLTKSKVEYRDTHGNLCPERINKMLSPRLIRIIKKCTSYNPKSRVQSMADVLNMLQNAEKSVAKINFRINFVFDKVFKLLIASMILIISSLFNKSGLVISLVLFVLLLLICKRPTYFTWETRKEIFKSSVSLTALLIFLLASLNSTKSYAYPNSEAYSYTNNAACSYTNKKDVLATERLDITLYDDKNRKLLIRPGCTWEINSDILFSLSKSEIYEPCTITISCMNDSGTKSYSFDCAPLN